MTVLTAALLGLLGSAHCLAMCGPLVLAVGAPRHGSPARRLLHVGTYHAGRVAMYALLGLVVGTAGSALAMAGVGRLVAVAGGLGLLAAGIGPVVKWRGPSWSGPWISVAARAAAAARAWQARHPVTGPFAAGLANGLLPCSMVYAALAVAITANGIGQASWTMAAFGAGTVPALAGLSAGAGHLRPAWRRRLAGAAPAGLALVGLLLVARGLTPARVLDVTAPPAHGAHAPHH